MTQSGNVKLFSPATVREGVDVLRSGGLVVLPTLTNYGLFCDPFNADAIRRLFEAKNRTKFGPLTLFIAEPAEAEQYVRVPDSIDRNLAWQLWPSPAAMICWRAYPFPDQLTLGLPTLAVCCQGKGAALHDVLLAAGQPLGASSANLSGQGSIDVTLDVAVHDLASRVDLIIAETPEQNAARKPQEHPGNSIVDLTFDPPRLVRHGFVSPATMRQYLPGLNEDVDGYPALLEQRRGEMGGPSESGS